VLRAAGVPTAMQWFCGGHGVCLTPAGNTAAAEQATLAWLKRYVQRDTSVDTGPGFSFVDQNGTTYSAPSYPVAPGTPVTATGTGSLPLVAGGGSGPVTSVPAGQELAAWWHPSPRRRPRTPSTCRSPSPGRWWSSAHRGWC